MESAIKGGGGSYYISIDSKNGVSIKRLPAPVAGSNSLMAQSREQLTMDLSKSDSMFSSPRSKGCYVTKLKAFGLMLFFFLVTVAVGFITFHIGNCSDSIFGTIGSSSSSNSLNPSSTPITKIRDVRLPKSILPTYYKIELIPYVDPAKNFSIDGKVSIKFMCLEKTNKITVHIKNITVHESSVKVMLDDENVASESNYDISVTQHDYDQLRDFYHVSVDQELSPGQNYKVYIEFKGILSDELAGFYRSSYTDKATNETRWIGITQFQATDARRAFPCFDEPGLKASFEVSLARQKNMTTLSNMDLNRTEEISDMPNWVWDHYNPSVPMSTYLVAFAVTDFESKLSPRSYSRPEFRVWARKDAISQADFSSEIGPKILTYFEEYFNISFPLPKLDMVGLTDFSAGAMENWGLITYRETAMLFDPKVSSDSSKQRVAVVISHEIAHQWFGNLVTPSWWSDLWLNEGFASYVEYIGVDHVLPDWKILDQFVTDEIHEVFKLDALDSSHPISVQVHHPDEISEIFDSISYAKGASI